MEFLIAPLCIGCWVLPLILIGFTYGLVRWVSSATAMRGVDGDGLYCAKCKFDVRGNTGWDCPECGAPLDQGVGPGWPRGGLLSRDLHPPMSRGMAVLVFVVGGFVPGVVLVIVLGMVLPVNYKSYLSVVLSPDVPVVANVPNPPQVTFHGERERGWLGGGEIESLTYGIDYGFSAILIPRPPDASATFEQQADEAWAEVSSLPGWMPPGIDAEPYREEFVELFVLIGEDRRSEAEARASGFIVEWNSYQEASFAPLYILFAAVAVGVWLILLAWWAVRENARSDRAFRDQVGQLHNKYDAIVERNRARLGG